MAQMKTNGVEINPSHQLINLQRCMMTLNGVATSTGAGNPRPSEMLYAAALDVLEKEGDGAADIVPRAIAPGPLFDFDA